MRYLLGLLAFHGSTRYIKTYHPTLATVFSVIGIAGWSAFHGLLIYLGVTAFGPLFVVWGAAGFVVMAAYIAITYWRGRYR